MSKETYENLKRGTYAGSTLISSPQSRRLAEHQQDLIIIAYEACMHRRGNSLSLTKLEYVKGEKNGAKYSMHFHVLVKDLDLNESVPFTLTCTVNTEYDPCSAL